MIVKRAAFPATSLLLPSAAPLTDAVAQPATVSAARPWTPPTDLASREEVIAQVAGMLAEMTLEQDFTLRPLVNDRALVVAIRI